MRARIQSDSSKYSRLITEVFSGNFPANDVNRMNLAVLEKFVLRLVEHTSADMSAKTLSRIKCKDKPKWWPSDVLIEDCITKEKVKQFRTTLKELIVNCCNFFKTYNVTWLPNSKSRINDENFDVVRGIKRGGNDVYHPSHTSKRRKTLLSKNFTADVPNESANIFDDISEAKIRSNCSEPPVESDPLDQVGFLKLFSLGLNNNAIVQTEQPVFSRLLKFHNCPHIPLSSDAGKLMMKNEKYSVPEYVITRKLDRVEWYINKQMPRVGDIKFEITYVPPKYTYSHLYKFPKRQLHQVRGNHAYNEFLFKLCKSVVIVIKNEDLLAKKKILESCKMCVTVPRVSENIIKQHLCSKDILIQIHNVVDKPMPKMQLNKFGRRIKAPNN